MAASPCVILSKRHEVIVYEHHITSVTGPMKGAVNFTGNFHVGSNFVYEYYIKNTYTFLLLLSSVGDISTVFAIKLTVKKIL